MKNTITIIIFAVLLILIVWLIYLHNNPQQSSTLTTAPTIGQRTKDHNCQVNGPLPDKECTPGAIFQDVTAEQICVRGYSKSVRNVPVALKREYGITHHNAGEYEVDHHISLELGGSNDIANLWPEAAEPRPGFHEKDKVENYLHAQVCSGRMELRDAQVKIANDWLSVYKAVKDRD